MFKFVMIDHSLFSLISMEAMPFAAAPLLIFISFDAEISSSAIESRQVTRGIEHRFGSAQVKVHLGNVRFLPVIILTPHLTLLYVAARI